jgi:Tfp pilus assembly protein PilN
MKQTGADFSLQGYAVSLPSLSDFVTNLEATRWFIKPVEILDSQVQSDARVGDLVRFSLKATLNNPEAPPLPAGRGGK